MIRSERARGGSTVKVLDIMIPIMLALLLAVIVISSVWGGYTITLSDGDALVRYGRVRYGEALAEPVTPARAGYRFDGWYEDAELSSRWDFEEDTVAGDTVLYAKWSAE